MIENINPTILKTMSLEQLEQVAAEIRHAVLYRVSHCGGHVGPNLGIVEATIALHYVFSSPTDKFVFDVSHQSYPHKILTSRAAGFIDENCFASVSGYTKPQESEHDMFEIGHTSTSVSLACGLAKGRDLCGGKENIVAVIGDGSLSGGEALEALDYAGAELGTNLIILVNDNQMSIAENHGGLYKNLQLLRETNGKAENNLFRAMGLDYMYVAEGNDIATLIRAFEQVKDIDHPIVVHINTLKGKGYEPAVENKERWHWSMPFALEPEDVSTKKGKDEEIEEEYYSAITRDALMEEIEKDERVVVVNAATPGAFGLTEPYRKRAGKQYVDVGIAEEHAVALVSGIAKRGGKPVFTVNATFLQRAYDQLVQDLSLNNNSALLLVWNAGVWGMNDATHIGHFDIQELAHIPNLLYLTPTSKEEYLEMLHWGIHQTARPVAIRVPTNGVNHATHLVDNDFEDWHYQVVQAGSNIALIALGSMWQIAEQVAAYYKKQTGLNLTLINPRSATEYDMELLKNLKRQHSVVVTLEDGVKEGGWGEHIAALYGSSDMRVLCYGLEKGFADNYDYDELLAANGITKEQITQTLIDLFA